MTKEKRIPTVGENQAEMAALLAVSPRLQYRVSQATKDAMAAHEAMFPSSELVGRPKL